MEKRAEIGDQKAEDGGWSEIETLKTEILKLTRSKAQKTKN